MVSHLIYFASFNPLLLFQNSIGFVIILGNRLSVPHSRTIKIQ